MIQKTVPYLNKKVQDCAIKFKETENEPIVIEYTYSKSKVTISDAYEVKNCYGNMMST